MTDISKEREEELLDIYNEWCWETLSCWVREVGAWDNLLEDETISVEE